MMAPTLAAIKEIYHNDITKASQPQQLIKDVTGQTIGRVPEGLASVVSQGFRDGWLRHGIAIHEVGFIHAGIGKGGGPQLKSIYVFLVKERITGSQVADRVRGYACDFARRGRALAETRWRQQSFVHFYYILDQLL